MNSLKVFGTFFAVAFLAAPLLSASGSNTKGRALITIMPKSGAGFTHDAPQTSEMQLKVNGKTAHIQSVTHARGPESPIELVLLIDGGARESIGTQLSYITDFTKELPSNTRMAIAYMENGRAVFGGPFSSDPQQIQASLRLPSGPAGISASPYFCLSDLARHWPSQDQNARREVIMVSDGIDNYEPRYDPDDPYVGAAIKDSIRAGLTIYSIYWKSEGLLANLGWVASGGQSLLQQLTDATGGTSYWQGFGNPVSFAPYLKEIRARLEHQYQIEFSVEAAGKPEIQTMRLKVDVKDAKLSAPQMVFVTPQAGE